MRQLSKGIVTRRQFGCGLIAAGAALAAPRLMPALGKHHALPGLPPPPAVSGAESLRAHAAARGLLYGAAVVPELLDLEGAESGATTDAHTNLVAAQCGIL